MSRSAVAEVTGKMPLAGKHLMKWFYVNGRESSRSGEYTGKLASAASLGVFAAMHAVQFKLGIDELTDDHQQGALLTGVDAAYTTVNAMATYTQAYLGAKVMTTGRGPESDTQHRLGVPTPLELVVTAGGQALFLSTMQ